MYIKLDGPPIPREAVKFNYFVRSLIKLYWQQMLQDQADIEAYLAWKAEQEDDDDTYGLFEAIKKVVVDD